MVARIEKLYCLYRGHTGPFMYAAVTTSAQRYSSSGIHECKASRLLYMNFTTLHEPDFSNPWSPTKACLSHTTNVPYTMGEKHLLSGLLDCLTKRRKLRKEARRQRHERKNLPQTGRRWERQTIRPAQRSSSKTRETRTTTRKSIRIPSDNHDNTTQIPRLGQLVC